MAVLAHAGLRNASANPLNDLGLSALAEGNYELARRRFEEALDIARECRAEGAVANTLADLGVLAYLEEQHGQARELVVESLEKAGRLGRSILACQDVLVLGAIAVAQHDLDEGAWLLGAADALYASFAAEPDQYLVPIRDDARRALDKGHVDPAVEDVEALTIDAAVRRVLGSAAG